MQVAIANKKALYGGITQLPLWILCGARTGNASRSFAPIVAMDFPRESALRRQHLALRRSISVISLLRYLRCSEGGFLTEEEYASITDQSDNAEQVDELIKVLLTKKDKDFEWFCDILKKHSYKWWSEKLKEAAGEPAKNTISYY